MLQSQKNEVFSDLNSDKTLIYFKPYIFNSREKLFSKKDLRNNSN